MSRAAARRGLPVMTAGIAAPADRRFRRPDLRPPRSRRLGLLVWRVVRTVIAVAIVLGISAWLARVVLGSKFLAVSHLVVRGNTRLSTGEVEALLDSITGQSILRVSLVDARKRLMESPWVEDATLWRVLPSTVGVEVVERVPMAIARSGQRLYLVDERGAIIDEYGPQYADFDLLLVDGLIRGTAKGAAANTAGAVLTGRFIDAMRTQPNLRSRISQIDISDGRDVVVLLSDGPTAIHLGDTRFIDRLNMYLKLAPTLAQQFKGIESVDFRFDQRVGAPNAGADPTEPLTVVVRSKGRVKETVKVAK